MTTKPRTINRVVTLKEILILHGVYDIFTGAYSLSTCYLCPITNIVRDFEDKPLKAKDEQDLIQAYG